MDITVSQIMKMPPVADVLASVFGVNFSRSHDEQVWFAVRAKEQFSPFASEGAGGVFLRGAASGAILYVSSEGQAGVIAASLTEFLQLVLAHPNWLDLLKFSGGGRLSEMERVAPYLDREFLDDEPDADASRNLVAKALCLAPGLSQISKLHHAVTVLGNGITVHVPDAWQCDGLFGSFVVENNPMWRNV